MAMDKAQHRMLARLAAIRTTLEEKEELFQSRVAAEQFTPEERMQSLSELASLQAQIETMVTELQRQIIRGQSD